MVGYMDVLTSQQAGWLKNKTDEIVGTAELIGYKNLHDTHFEQFVQKAEEIVGTVEKNSTNLLTVAASRLYVLNVLETIDNRWRVANEKC